MVEVKKETSEKIQELLRVYPQLKVEGKWFRDGNWTDLSEASDHELFLMDAILCLIAHVDYAWTVETDEEKEMAALIDNKIAEIHKYQS